MKHCFQLIVFSCSVRRNVHSFLSQPNNANGRLVMGRSARNAVRWRRGNGFNFVPSLRMWCSRKCWTTCANWFRSIVIEISRKIYGSKLWLTCSQLYCVVFYVSPFCPHLLSIEVPQTEHWKPPQDHYNWMSALEESQSSTFWSSSPSTLWLLRIGVEWQSSRTLSVLFLLVAAVRGGLFGLFFDVKSLLPNQRNESIEMELTLSSLALCIINREQTIIWQINYRLLVCHVCTSCMS